MSLELANARAIELWKHPVQRETGADDLPESPDTTRCFVCLRAVERGGIRRRMLTLCARHGKQELGIFYMRMSDTGRFQTFPNEE